MVDEYPDDSYITPSDSKKLEFKLFYLLASFFKLWFVSSSSSSSSSSYSFRGLGCSYPPLEDNSLHEETPIIVQNPSAD